MLHGLSTEAELDILREPGARPVSAAEVRASTGTEKESWRQAIEEEFVKNFVERNVYTPSTEEEKRRHGPALPMKLVFAQKPNKKKARAVVCGNFQRSDPSQQLWTPWVRSPEERLVPRKKG